VLVATRASALARVQAGVVRRALQAADHRLELGLLELTTSGDRLQDVPLEQVEGSGFFIDALERALREGRAQFAAHSLKDLPTEIGAEFELAAVLAREDPRDVLVSPHGGLARLPREARVGTDSSRRRSQLQCVRPDLRFLPVRGNVPTRLAKLDRGEFDALVLAAAGLNRLGLSSRISELLEPGVCLPAPGQGAIAVEALARSEWAAIGARADDSAARAEVTAGRAFLEALGGGCQAPIGALARRRDDVLVLQGVLVERGRPLRVELAGDSHEAAELGRAAARRLLALAG